MQLAPPSPSDSEISHKRDEAGGLEGNNARVIQRGGARGLKYGVHRKVPGRERGGKASEYFFTVWMANLVLEYSAGSWVDLFPSVPPWSTM